MGLKQGGGFACGWLEFVVFYDLSYSSWKSRISCFFDFVKIKSISFIYTSEDEKARRPEGASGEQFLTGWSKMGACAAGH
jgi:hypothetical protein